ncbi:MAG: hypothetical protein GXO86_07765 [Chlorobi bacterium]|nr:hypothetical protein [Chlorobiota bacterium]
MPEYKLTEVTDKKTVKKFLELPVEINRGDDNWIRPLDDDIEKIFDRKKNKLFRNGDAIRWIMEDNNGKVVGRVAAFYDEATAKKNDQPTGGIGFFECINDQQAANLLFDTSREWLKNKGMEAMDGPVNFGSRENFWGCLADGFYEPIYKMPYNPKYYNDLFEGYGFRNYFNQYTYHMPLNPDLLDPVIREKADRLSKNPKYRFIIYDKKQMEKFAEDFMIIFNKAWGPFSGVKPFSRQQALGMFKSMKPVADPRTLIFGYYDNQPIGFFIMIPDLYQAYRHFDGRFGTVNKLRLLYKLKVSKNFTRLVGLIFGVIPEFQKKGATSGLILRFEKEVVKPDFHYTDLEMNWIGDFNPAMMKIAELIGSKIRKTHITYRYLFDRKKEFKRAKKVS